MAKTIFNMADGIVTPCNCVPWNVTCGMWLWNHDSEFTKWQHPAMWHVRGSGRTCRWIRPAAAPCNVTRSSGIMTSNSPGGSTLQCGRWLWDDMSWNSPKRPPYWNSNLVSISTISPQSTYHSAAVCEILSKSDHPQQKKITSCRFSRWRISAILDLMGPIMGFFEKPTYDFL